MQTEIRVFGTKFGIFEVLKYKTVDAFLNRHLPFLHEMPDFKGTNEERENELRELYALCVILALPIEQISTTGEIENESIKKEEHDDIPRNVQKSNIDEPKPVRNSRGNRANGK